MKNRLLRTAGYMMVALLITGVYSGVFAQGVEKNKLTDDQQKQMAELKIKFQEETGNIRNLIGEKQAHLKTLIDTDNRDMKDLDKTVDELSALKGQLILKGIAHRDAVKKILTPEQMIIWEKMAQKRMDEGSRGPGHRGARGEGRPVRGGRPMQEHNRR